MLGSSNHLDIVQPTGQEPAAAAARKAASAAAAAAAATAAAEAQLQKRKAGGRKAGMLELLNLQHILIGRLRTSIGCCVRCLGHVSSMHADGCSA